MADLTAEEMQRIVNERMNDVEPSNTSKEADEFRASIEKDIEEAKEKGWEVSIPGEWEI